MTVRDVVLHSQYMITSRTPLRIMRLRADGEYDIIAKGTKCEDAILGQSGREVNTLYWDAFLNRVDIWVARDD